MKDWLPFIFAITSVIAIVSAAIIFGGCNEIKEYKRLRAVCKKMCKTKQKENVGASFFYKDLEATFGECKCYGRNGDVKKINISINDLREEK